MWLVGDVRLTRGCPCGHHHCAAFSPILHLIYNIGGKKKNTFPSCQKARAAMLPEPFDRCHSPTPRCHFPAPVTDHTKELPLVSIKHYLGRKRCFLWALDQIVGCDTFYCLSLISYQQFFGRFDPVILIAANSLKLLLAPRQNNLALACLLCNIANDVARVDS